MGDVVRGCQKVAYPNRKTARRTLRRLYPNDPLRAYHCPRCGWWHGGHNPPAVKSGLMTAVEYYARLFRPTTREETHHG